MAYNGGYELKTKVKSGKMGIASTKNAKNENAKGEDSFILDYVNDCISAGKTYRDSFKKNWDEVLDQIACNPPPEWDNKEDWQTKVYLPEQAKNSEVASTALSSLLFPYSFFALSGIEASDRDIAVSVQTLIKTLLSKGGFYDQNNFVVEESCDIGTSAIKILVAPDKKSLNFYWRSSFNYFVDPSARHDINKLRWVVDEYKKDMGDLVAEYNSDKSIYDKEAIKSLYDSATNGSASKAEDDMATIRSLDGTSVVSIPKAKKEVTLYEFWGDVKVPKKKGDDKTDATEYVYESRVITVADGVVLRNEINPYGFLPFCFMRIKRRKYDFYGKGYLYNVVGLQELMNSMINLGFDSLKINSMDIIKLNVNAVDDPQSIQYKPLAIWKMRDVRGAEISRTNNGISAINDVLRGVQFIGQIMQEATGITRQVTAGGAIAPSGAETLGEYQSKMQMTEKRFLGQGAVVEKEYIIPLLQKIYSIITNQNLFSQEGIDDILGVDADGNAILPMAELMSRDFAKNFKAVGITNMMENLEAFARIQKFLMVVLQDPKLRGMISDERLLKQLSTSLGMTEEELAKTAKEIDAETAMQNQALQQQLAQQQQMQGQPPIPTEQPQMPQEMMAGGI